MRIAPAVRLERLPPQVGRLTAGAKAPIPSGLSARLNLDYSRDCVLRTTEAVFFRSPGVYAWVEESNTVCSPLPGGLPARRIGSPLKGAGGNRSIPRSQA